MNNKTLYLTYLLVIVSDGWDLRLLNDYLTVALILWVGSTSNWIFDRSWVDGLILNHIHWIILMGQLNYHSLVRYWVTPASHTFLLMTLICLFNTIQFLIIRFYGYLSLQSLWRHHFIIYWTMFLQDYLRTPSLCLPTTNSTIGCMVRRLLLVIFDCNWGSGWILTVFLAIRLLELLLLVLLLLFQLSVHRVPSLSDLIN